MSLYTQKRSNFIFFTLCLIFTFLVFTPYAHAEYLSVDVTYNPFPYALNQEEEVQISFDEDFSSSPNVMVFTLDQKTTCTYLLDCLSQFTSTYYGPVDSFTYTASQLLAKTCMSVSVAAFDNQLNLGFSPIHEICFQPPPDDPNLIAYFPFDTDAADYAGDYDGTFQGGASISPDGKLGSALLLDGVDDFVDLVPFDIQGQEMTIASWFNRTSGAGDARLISKATGQQEDEHLWMFSLMGSADQLRYRLNTDGITDTLISPALVQSNTWHHGAVVYDGNEIKIYLDGNLISSQPKTGNIGVDPSVDVYIGNNPGAFPKFFGGKIDDLRVYDRALSQEEIDVLADNLVCNFDGICDAVEDSCGCASDCGSICGDGCISGAEVCEIADEQQCTTTSGYSGTASCLSDCSGFDSCQSDLYCGDGICTQPVEDAASCSSDCFCGDGICDVNETATSCVADCSGPPSFYVSPDGSGAHDGSSLSDAMSLSEALAHSGDLFDQTVIYLLGPGDYGEFKSLVSRTAWHTWKADPVSTDDDNKPVFSKINFKKDSSPQISIKLIMDGLEVYPNNVAMRWIRDFTFTNGKIHGEVTEPFGPTTFNCDRYVGPQQTGFWQEGGNRNITLTKTEISNHHHGANAKGSFSHYEDNIIHGIGEDAANFPWGESDDLQDKQSFIFRNNEIYNVGDCFEPGNPDTDHPDAIQSFISFTKQYEVTDVRIEGNRIGLKGPVGAQGIFIQPGTSGIFSNVTIEGNIVNASMQSLQVKNGDDVKIRHNTFMGGSAHIYQGATNVVQEYNLHTNGNIYHDDANPLVFDKYIVNGWMDPAWDATGPDHCKGPVAFGADGITPLCDQPSGHCDVDLWGEIVGAVLTCE